MWRDKQISDKKRKNLDKNKRTNEINSDKNKKNTDNAHRGARTHDHKVKSLALYQLS
jgi:hypothetical protein